MVWDDPKPGYKWPVEVALPIAATKEKVWEAISIPGNLEQCHPYCAKNPVQAWPGVGAQDEVHYPNGLIFKRRFCLWIEGEGYDLNIGKPDGKTSFVSWRIKSVDKQKSILRIAVYPHVLQEVPAAIRWLPYHLYIIPMLRNYLSSVVRGFEWYIIRGESVPRNQFGSHPWFSDSKPSECNT
jgi:hypothetical protein